MPTLVVVDMQRCFPAACDPDVIVGVTIEILQAKRRGHGVIFLEYAGCGPSHIALTNLTEDYAKVTSVSKDADDGSEEVLETIKNKRFDLSRIRICGVNADCCVAATVDGLLNKLRFSKIDVVKNACGWTNLGRHSEGDWMSYPSHPNLNLTYA